MTLTEAFKAYSTDVIAFRNQSAKTEEHHNVTLKSLVLFLGNIPIGELTFSDVRDWKLSMEARNLSVITIRGYLIKLRVVLAYLAGRGFKVLDPIQIPLPKRIDRVPNVITPAQVELLIDSTDKLRNKTIISMLYSTGLRVSELCSLNINNIAENYFTVTGKGGKSRICFIDQRTRRLLNRYLKHRQGYNVYVNVRGVQTTRVRYKIKQDNNPALFIERISKNRLTPGGVQDIFKYARKKAGFNFPVHPHTLRHSYASNMMINGIDLYQLSKLMGHSSIATTQIYLHISDKHLAEDYQKYHSV